MWPFLVVNICEAYKVSLVLIISILEEGTCDLKYIVEDEIESNNSRNLNFSEWMSKRCQIDCFAPWNVFLGIPNR